MGKTLATLALLGTLALSGIGFGQDITQKEEKIRYFKGIVKNENYTNPSLFTSAKYQFTLETKDGLKVFNVWHAFSPDKVNALIDAKDTVEVRVVKDINFWSDNHGNNDFLVRYEDIISVNREQINKK